MTDTITAAALVVVALYAVLVAWQRCNIAANEDAKPGRWPGIATEETTRSPGHWRAAHRAAARTHSILGKALGIELVLTCLYWLQFGSEIHSGIFVALSATAITGFTLAQKQAIDAAAALDSDHEPLFDMSRSAVALRAR